jgi:hypothetical protein
MKQRCDNCINWQKSDIDTGNAWGICHISKVSNNMVEAISGLRTKGDFGCRFWDRMPAPKPHKRKGPPLSESLMGEIVEEFLKTRSIYTTALVLDCSRSTVRRYVVNAGLSSMISSSWGRRNLTLERPSTMCVSDPGAQHEQIGY